MSIRDEIEHYLIKLATGADFSTVLHDLVTIIEGECPEMKGLILLLDEDGQHLHHGAAVSLPEEYTQSIEGLEIGPMVGSCGTASYLGERVIVEDIATDPRWDGLRSLGLQYGLRACWSQPVFSPQGTVIGTFAMYYTHPRAPTDSELQVIETAAHLAGVAIESHRLQSQLRQSQEELEERVRQRTLQLQTTQDALQQSERRYRTLVENANSIIIELDTTGTITFINRFAQDFFRFAESEILGKNVVGTIVPATDSTGQDMTPFIDQILKDPERYGNVENENVRKDGERVWVAWTNRVVQNLETGTRQVLGIGIDRTEQKRIERILTQETAARAADEERHRLARDLHDAVSQTLFSLGLICEVLPTIWEKDQAHGRQRLEEVRQLSRSALAEMRTLLFELRPSALDEAELGELLRQLADTVTGRSRLPVRLEISFDEVLPSEVKVALYRIAQEALNNVAKHSAATEASVSLDGRPTGVRLRIRDNGRGFQVASIPAGSLGVGIMTERARAIGAELSITSEPGEGTEVRLIWHRCSGKEA